MWRICLYLTALVCRLENDVDRSDVRLSTTRSKIVGHSEFLLPLSITFFRDIALSILCSAIYFDQHWYQSEHVSSNVDCAIRRFLQRCPTFRWWRCVWAHLSLLKPYNLTYSRSGEAKDAPLLGSWTFQYGEVSLHHFLSWSRLNSHSTGPCISPIWLPKWMVRYICNIGWSHG